MGTSYSSDTSTIAVSSVSSSFTSPVNGNDNEEEPPRKKARRVSNCSSTKKMSKSTSTKKKKKTVPMNKKKKLQLRYDPDVPMTEEETAVWRIDQRRKRNRESAALTRQKQRDRIGVLAVEVQAWKSKHATIMERIQQLETEAGIDS